MLPRRQCRYSGRILLDGTELLHADRAQLRRVQGKAIGVVFQEPMSSMDPLMKVGRQVEEVLELPEGALGNCVRLEMAGNRRVVIEGCRGIQEYEEGLIRLSTTSGTIRFMGRGLVMNCLTEDCAVITGFLLSVEFLS